MAYFDQGNKGKGFGKRDFGGGGRFRDKRSFGGGNRGGAFMHKATCAECGKECEVPFKPVAGRPVYCSNCFETRGGGKPNHFTSDKPRFENRAREEHGGNNKQILEQFAVLNSKLDSILKALTPAAPQPEPAEEKRSKPAKKSTKAALGKKKKAKK